MQALSRYLKGTSLEGSDFRGCNIFRPGSVPPSAVIFLGRASRRDKQAAWETLWSSRLGIPLLLSLKGSHPIIFRCVRVADFSGAVSWRVCRQSRRLIDSEGFRFLKCCLSKNLTPCLISESSVVFLCGTLVLRSDKHFVLFFSLCKESNTFLLPFRVQRCDIS